MCTVTLIARRNGYALGMNRDERLARVAALPPKNQRLERRHALFPSEPNGGTWIGVNDAGVKADRWDIVGLNALEELPYYYLPWLDKQQGRIPTTHAPGNCSARDVSPQTRSSRPS